VAGPLQLVLPDRALAGVRTWAGFPSAPPFLLGALLSSLLASDHGGYWPTSWGWATLVLVWATAIALGVREVHVSRLELVWIGGIAALTGWTALSWFWTASRTQTALEIERTLQALTRSGDALKHGNIRTAVAAAADARRWAPWSSRPWQQLAANRIVQGDRQAALNVYRSAVAKDPRDWKLWLDLASVSNGRERARAPARLSALKPGAGAAPSSGSP
jgi:hypothetical protein